MFYYEQSSSKEGVDSVGENKYFKNLLSRVPEYLRETPLVTELMSKLQMKFHSQDEIHKEQVESLFEKIIAGLTKNSNRRNNRLWAELDGLLTHTIVEKDKRDNEFQLHLLKQQRHIISETHSQGRVVTIFHTDQGMFQETEFPDGSSRLTRIYSSDNP